MCTVIAKDGKEDKEIKSSYFMSTDVDHNSDDTKKNDNNKKNIDTNHYFSPFTTTTISINAEHIQEKK